MSEVVGARGYTEWSFLSQLGRHTVIWVEKSYLIVESSSLLSNVNEMYPFPFPVRGIQVQRSEIPDIKPM